MPIMLANQDLVALHDIFSRYEAGRIVHELSNYCWTEAEKLKKSWNDGMAPNHDEYTKEKRLRDEAVTLMNVGDRMERQYEAAKPLVAGWQPKGDAKMPDKIPALVSGVHLPKE